MPKPWTKLEEKKNKEVLVDLYIKQNKTINEIGNILNLSYKTVFKRMKKLGIRSTPNLKTTYPRNPKEINFSRKYSNIMAEFFGVMLGDGHLSHFQVQINLGNKDKQYVEYLVNLIERIFGIKPKISLRKTGYIDIYFGSVIATKWLVDEGLVYNKVKSQVDMPEWIFSKKSYMRSFLRGFFDTDGSIYKLKFGLQLSFTNNSKKLLNSLHKVVYKLEYKPSKVCNNRFYITNKFEINRFFKEVSPKNPKHLFRFKRFNASIV